MKYLLLLIALVGCGSSEIYRPVCGSYYSPTHRIPLMVQLSKRNYVKQLCNPKLIGIIENPNMNRVIYTVSEKGGMYFIEVNGCIEVWRSDNMRCVESIEFGS